MTTAIILGALAFGLVALAAIAWLASVMWRTETADAEDHLHGDARQAERELAAALLPTVLCQWCTDKAFPDSDQCTCSRPCGRSYCKALSVRELLLGDTETTTEEAK